MIYVKLFVFQLLFLYCTLSGFAQKVRLDNCYVTHNCYSRILGVYPDGNSPCGMYFNLKMQVDGYKGKTLWCVIELAFYDGNESYYFRSTGDNYSFDNHLAVCKKLMPSYDAAIYNNLQLFLPHSEIGASIGKSDWCKEITYCVKVIDANGSVIFKEWQTSTKLMYEQSYNKPQDCTACRGSRICSECYGQGIIWLATTYMRCMACGGTGRCRYCSTGGINEPWTLNERKTWEPRPFNIYNQPSNNLPNSNSTNGRCPICYGSGKCPTCAGRGEKSHYNRHTNMNEWSDCGVCNGTGRCWACKGSGKE